MSNPKRPAKQLTVNFILSCFQILKAGVPGTTLDTIKAQLNYGSYFLYENEVTDIIKEQKEKDPAFDENLFLDMLSNADAIVEGSRQPFGGKAGGAPVRINSMERALEVANNPADAERISELVSQILAIGKELDPLISEKAQLSVALKNKKQKEEEVPESADATNG